jgi:uncharacterized circularly permuted ATP-grasp superfamily protein
MARQTIRPVRVAVRNVQATLGQRRATSVQCRAQSVNTMPCQRSIGGFVFTMSNISDLSGSQWPLAAVPRVIYA